MEIGFKRTGAERKALVAAVSEVTGVKAKYMGAPGFAYRVGGYTISKDGAVDTGAVGEEDIALMLAALEERGFVPVETPEVETPVALAIELPDDGFSDTALGNLQKLAAGKAALIRRALGDNLAEDAEMLPIVVEDGKVQFAWFRFGMDADSIAAWSFFTSALCEVAKKQKRVTLKEKPLGEGDSEKFAMRCFLLKLGFIGKAYKDARRIILAGLPGDGTHKGSGHKDGMD